MQGLLEALQQLGINQEQPDEYELLRQRIASAGYGGPQEPMTYQGMEGAMAATPNDPLTKQVKATYPSQSFAMPAPGMQDQSAQLQSLLQDEGVIEFLRMLNQGQ